MKHIYLVGDSIIDNSPYVQSGHSVTDYLVGKTKGLCEVTKLAIDGDITRGALNQLQKVGADCSHLIISVGGNDALQSAHELCTPVTNIVEGFEHMAVIIKGFKQNYQKVLKTALSICPEVTVATIYNKVPGLGDAENTALALFNEAILELALAYGVNVIDLRNICTSEYDYAPISPIEPSEAGSDKISQAIINIVFHSQYLEQKTIAPSLIVAD